MNNTDTSYVKKLANNALLNILINIRTFSIIKNTPFVNLDASI